MNKLTCSRMADFYWRIQFLSTTTTGNPDVWSYTRSPAPHLRQYVIVVLVSNRHFNFSSLLFWFRFSCFCVVVEASLQPQFCREFSSLRIVFAKIRQVLTSLVSPFALCCVRCVVVEFHSSHSVTISLHITPHFHIIFKKIRQVSASFKASFA